MSCELSFLILQQYDEEDLIEEKTRIGHILGSVQDKQLKQKVLQFALSVCIFSSLIKVSLSVGIIVNCLLGFYLHLSSLIKSSS